MTDNTITFEQEPTPQSVLLRPLLKNTAKVLVAGVALFGLNDAEKVSAEDLPPAGSHKCKPGEYDLATSIPKQDQYGNYYTEDWCWDDPVVSTVATTTTSAPKPVNPKPPVVVTPAPSVAATTTTLAPTATIEATTTEEPTTTTSIEATTTEEPTTTTSIEATTTEEPTTSTIEATTTSNVNSRSNTAKNIGISVAAATAVLAGLVAIPIARRRRKDD